MAERGRIPITFGGGLDRATGVFGVGPHSMRDVRNVFLYRDKLQARTGFAAVNQFVDDGGVALDAVVGVQAMAAEQIGIIVGYADGDREVHVYRVDGDGLGSDRIGAWGTLVAGAQTPPRVLAAESYRKVFLAHDEVRLANRLPTYYYDPFAATQLVKLTAALGRGTGGPEGAGLLSVNGAHGTSVTTISLAKAAGVNWEAKAGDIITFAGDSQLYEIAGDVTVVQNTNTNVTITPGLLVALSGAEAVTARATLRFRGITTHLNYVVGWGYGTGADENRPEIVRVSLPADPLVWEGDDFFLAGVRDDPVLRCESLGALGSPFLVFKGSETHEIFGYDKRSFGIRRIDDLYGIAGARLAVAVNGVCYVWSLEGPRATSGGGPSREIGWPLDLDAPTPTDLVAEGATADGFATYLPGRRVVLFVFGRRVYALSIWQPDQPKWAYWELGFPAFSAGIIQSGGTALSAAPTAAPSGVSGIPVPGNPDALRISWTNNSIDGDEFVEVWLKPNGGVWAREANPVALGATQQVDIDGLAFAQAPSLDTTAWARIDATTERITLGWTSPTYPTTIVRDGGDVATVAAGVGTYPDEAVVGETFEVYTLRRPNVEVALRYRRGPYYSPSSSSGNPDDWPAAQKGTSTTAQSASVSQWAGPDLPPTALSCNNTECGGGGSLQVRVNWTNGDANLETEVWSRNITDTLPYELSATAAAGATGACVIPPGATAGDSAAVNVRHKQTSFTVEDFSPFTGGGPDPQIDECLVTVP